MKHLGSVVTIVAIVGMALGNIWQVPAPVKAQAAPAGLTQTPEPPTNTPTPIPTDTPTPIPTLTPPLTATATVEGDGDWNILIIKPKGVTWWILVPWLERPEGLYTGPE
jgi:hypothetical protein